MKKFTEISKDHLKEKLIEKEQLKDLSHEGIYKNGKAVILGRELIDARTKIYNKGEAVKQLIELFGGADKNFPIYVGDAVREEKDDEYAMKEISDMGGIGIAIIHRDDNEIDKKPAFRSYIETEASYKLDSFNETVPFLEKFAQEFIPVK